MREQLRSDWLIISVMKNNQQRTYYGDMDILGAPPDHMDGFLPVGILFCHYMSTGGGCMAIPTTLSILSIMFLLVTEEG